jgi:rRNA processing protein Gar1
MHFFLDIRLKQPYIWITCASSQEASAQFDVRENLHMKNATKKAAKKAPAKKAAAKKKK